MNKHTIKVWDMEVVDIIHHHNHLFTLELKKAEGESGGEPLTIFPGQFLQLLIPNESGVFLRRPFSIFYQRGSHIGLLIQVAGKGTKALARNVRVGDTLNAILPLGNHFSQPTGNAPLLIGGGVGLAPMYALGVWLSKVGYNIDFLIGARTASLLPALNLFEEIGSLHITTEDGSAGEKGFVTEHSILKSSFTDIYTCGPTPMMKAVARYAQPKNVSCEVSLENHMACGFGVCLCCIEPTTSGHQTVCTKGPVFNVKELKW